jgi:uncharacterized RDD family membrane protein YckC
MDIKYYLNCRPTDQDKGISHYPEDGSNNISYCGFWKRLLAYIIDYMIIIIPLYILYILFQLLLGKPFNVFGIKELLFYYSAIIVIVWLYDSLFWNSKFQATPGKMILGMKVTDLAGQRLSFKKASLRWVGKLISFLMFGLGFLIIGFTEKKQGLHDFIAQTVVIQRRVS